MSTETMSGRERIMAALRGEDVDRIPWSPCIDGYFLEMVDQVDGFRRIGADAMLRHLFNYIGSAPFRISVPLPGKSLPWTTTTKHVGNKFEVTFETPVGNLMERSKINPESPNMPWVTRRRIQTIEDVKVLKWMCEQAEFAPMPSLFEYAEGRIGDDGITTISILSTPILWFLNSEFPIEEFWYMYFDHTKEMEELFEVAHQMILRMVTACAEGVGEVVIQYENLSTNLVSPQIWDKYGPRWLNEYAEILHSGDKIYLMHACGHLFDFGDRLSKVNLDGLVDIATPPTGNIPDLQTARELWGPDKFIMGGIDATFQTDLEPDELKDHVRDVVMKGMGDGRRMAVGSNDAVPKTTTWEKLEAITEVVKGEGAFPLNR